MIFFNEIPLPSQINNSVPQTKNTLSSDLMSSLQPRHSSQNDQITAPANQNQNEQLSSNAPSSNRLQNNSITTNAFSERAQNDQIIVPADQNEQIAPPSNPIQQGSGTLPSSSSFLKLLLC